MKDHFINLFLQAFTELELSLEKFKEDLSCLYLLHYPNESSVIAKKLERLSVELLESLSAHKNIMTNYKFDPSVVKQAMVQIKPMISTDMQIFLIEFDSLFASIKNKETVINLLQNRKNVLRKLEDLMYEKDNIIMISNIKPENNVIPFQQPKRKGHLTLIKS